MFFFFSIHSFHFWTRRENGWKILPLRLHFHLGLILLSVREDQYNNLRQWLASVLLTFFWFRLEFSYGQEKQPAFVQAFSKLNKVSIDCSFFAFSFCGKLLKSTQQQCYNKKWPLTFTCINTKVKFSFWNYLSRSSGNVWNMWNRVH